MSVREGASVLVRVGERIKRGIALRGAERHGAERMNAADGNPVGHFLEARDLLQGRVIAQLQLRKA